MYVLPILIVSRVSLYLDPLKDMYVLTCLDIIQESGSYNSISCLFWTKAKIP